jgi:carboxyl-terminal processing protease
MTALRRCRPFLGCAVVMLLTGSCVRSILGPDDTSPLGVYDAFWQEFDRHYAFFELEHIDWSGLRATTRPTITDATSGPQLTQVLCDLVDSLHDNHAVLISPFRSCSWTSRPSYPHQFVAQTVRMSPAYLAGLGQSSASGHMLFGRIGGDIGYVWIRDFNGDGWGPEIDGILAAFDGVRGVVIDIRDNGGGNESNAAAIAARFADQVRAAIVARFRDGSAHADFGQPLIRSVSPAGPRRFAGPVALLTNRYNGSSAEDFVMYMRVIPTTFTVGDTTVGTASNPLGRELPNGWTFRVPQSIESTPEGFIPEGRGFPPTLTVVFAPGDSARAADPVLDSALARLRAK